MTGAAPGARKASAAATGTSWIKSIEQEYRGRLPRPEMLQIKIESRVVASAITLD